MFYNSYSKYYKKFKDCRHKDFSKSSASAKDSKFRMDIEEAYRTGFNDGVRNFSVIMMGYMDSVDELKLKVDENENRIFDL